MRQLTRFSVLLIVATLLLGACGGDEEDGTDAGDATATATGTPTATAPAAATTESPTPPGGDGGGASAGADAAALAERFENAEFRATYEVDGAFEGQSVTGEWEWYQDGPGERLRIDFSSGAESSTLITTPEEILVCVEGACIRVPTGGTALPSMGELLTGRVDDVQETVASGEVTTTGSREIAGTDAECWEYRAEGGDVTGTVCYSSDGVPLLIESDAPEGTFRMEATAFDDSVSDEDFEPPSPVTSLPN